MKIKTLSTFIIRHLVILLLVCNLCIINSAFSSEKYSRVSINIAKNQIPHLQKAGISFDHFTYSETENKLETSLSSHDLKTLKALQISYNIIIDDEAVNFQKTNDVSKFYDAEFQDNQRLLFQSSCTGIANSFQTPAAFTPGSVGGYYNLSEMQQKLNQMLSTYPGLISQIAIGTTYEGRTLYAYKISDNVAVSENEAQVLFTGMHHAREPLSMMGIIFYMQYLLQNYNSNPSIAQIVNNRELYFIPCVNPDGYQYNISTNPSGGGMHRKNRNPQNYSATNLGVDLNRNYSVDWNADNLGSSTDPSNDSYCGTAPFSERESQAIRAFVNSKNFKFTIDFHSAGNYIVQAYGAASHTNIPADEIAFNNWFGYAFSKYSAYKPGTSKSTFGYYSNGASTDWYLAGDLNQRSKVYGFIIESGKTFWEPAANIIPICKEQMYPSLYASLIAGQYGEIQDKSDINVNAVITNFDFIYRRLGITNSDATVTLVPIEGVRPVGPNYTITIPKSSTPNLLDTITRSIPVILNPGILDGSVSNKIRFAWKLQFEDGTEIYDTIIKFYNPVVLFEDDMESGVITNKYIVSSGWDYTTKKKYQGNRSVTESPSGNYMLGRTNNLTIINTLNLTDASDAYISFWIHGAAVNPEDKLRVYLGMVYPSSVTNYNTVLCGTNTITESKGTLGNLPSYTGRTNEWRREIINLKNYLGSNVSIRFQFTSDLFNEDDGFYIDNIKIIKVTANKQTSGLTSNGQYYPFQKNNTDNSFAKKFSVFPNPTDGKIYLSSLSDNQITDYKIMDLSGKEIIAASNSSHSTLLEISLDNLAKGSYILGFTDSEGNQYFEKIIKQ